MDQRPDLKSLTIPWGGCTYSGAVANGVPDDLGKWSHPDGHEYIGEFREGKYMARAHTPDLTAQRLSADSLKDCQVDGGRLVSLLSSDSS